MERMACFASWKRYYDSLEPGLAADVARGSAALLEGRMRRAAQNPSPIIRGLEKRELVRAWGMALGVHKQLLWGLTCVPRGGHTGRVAGGF